MASKERSNQKRILPAETEVKSSSPEATAAVTMTMTMREVKSLFDHAMKNQWDEVVKIYKKGRNGKEEKITKTGDTVLHLAASYGLAETVVSMVESLKDGEAEVILSIENEKGNTALHLAAIAGDVDMCRSMVEKHRPLTTARNKESETPLFSAARQGNKLAFLYLQQAGVDVSLWRKNQGDTILHAAISGEYLDLAFQIVKSYPHLASYVNENGQTPLHILASKPNLFKSSYRFRHLDYLLYPCILIDQLKQCKFHQSSTQKLANGENQSYPQNYQTCMSFFNILRTALEMITTFKWEKPQKGDQENPQTKNNNDPNQATLKGEKQQEKDPYQGLFPPNYATTVAYFELTVKALLIVLGLGISRMQSIIEIKRSHKWAYQLMGELVDRASSYTYDANGGVPAVVNQDIPRSIEDEVVEPHPNKGTSQSELVAGVEIGMAQMLRKILKVYPEAFKDAFSDEKKSPEGKKKQDTAILIAAKKGVVEVVEKILDVFPVAIQDVDCNNKNVVLLAVEHRQPSVYQFLLQRKIIRDSNAFRQVDDQGNSALHLASIAGGHRPWLIPGAALQMQWELKWYKFVKSSMPPQTFATYNNKGQTAEDAFRDTHQDLIQKGSEWLTKTSESFSVVAALIATVAFSTSANIPGGVKEGTGTPNLKNQPAFNVFAVSSVIALCFSVTALVFFLAILTSRFQEKNFARDLPRKLLVGLTALFTSVAAILVSFCAGHFYVLGDLVRNAAYPIYAATCFPVTFFVLAQLPLYFDLVVAIISKVPTNSYQDFPE